MSAAEQQATNAALATLAATGNSYALGQLWETNRGLIRSMFWKWYPHHKSLADQHGVTADDFEQDAHSNCYNPLRYRYELDGDKLDEQSREAVAASLDLSVHRMASAYALLSCGVWTSILDSIFYESLYGIGNAVLKGTYHKPPRRIHFRIKAEKNEETV